jgi:site-specific DNA-cytosine methylase
MRPLALDLCCGLGGWSHGLLDAGWNVIGIDIEQWDGYPANDKRVYFVKKDVRAFTESELKLTYADVRLVCASPPCQEFSYYSFPFKRCRELAATIPPDKSIWQACEWIAKTCKAPLIMENVRGAQKYMGKAKAHYGSYYLWGDVPALLPVGNPQKGFQKNKVRTFGLGKDEKTTKNSMQRQGNRKEFAAKCAMIPFELAFWIGKCFYPRVTTLPWQPVV